MERGRLMVASVPKRGLAALAGAGWPQIQCKRLSALLMQQLQQQQVVLLSLPPALSAALAGLAVPPSTLMLPLMQQEEVQEQQGQQVQVHSLLAGQGVVAAEVPLAATCAPLQQAGGGQLLELRMSLRMLPPPPPPQASPESWWRERQPPCRLHQRIIPSALSPHQGL